MKLTEAQKKTREEIRLIHKTYNKERGKDRIKHNNVGDPDFHYRSFVLFGGTKVTEGGWYGGRAWMTAKQLLTAETRWVNHSYDTRADRVLKHTAVPTKDMLEALREIDNEYDLTAGVSQCGGCRWFADLDGDYGICCNEKSENDGRITFEHGGCIEHSSIQRLLNERLNHPSKFV